MKSAQHIIQPEMLVAIMGFGISGQAAMRYALARGARVCVSDSRDARQFADLFAEELEQLDVIWEAGGHTHQFFDDVDLVIVSPGISKWQPVLHAVMERGVPCLGELAIATPEIDVPVVAITGTNGKTTVTTLVGDLLRQAGKKVFVGGNIGTPLLQYLLADEKADILVLELSSFQLQFAGNFAPDVAVLLNITPDHLDHHLDMNEYIEAKMQIFARQDKEATAILCTDDQICADRAQHIKSRLFTYGHGSSCFAKIAGSIITMSWRDTYEQYDLMGSRLDFPIGLSNSAAALLAARSLGMEQQKLLKGLRDFIPLHHRLELVRELDGIRYVNDSKATNTGAVNAALLQTSGQVVLIAGGRHKGEDYVQLRDVVQNVARHIILIGEAAPLIEAALKDGNTIHRADSMEAAVELGQRLARPGDTVLLSPACSSFDMFTSYSHRGEVFTRAVMNLHKQEPAGKQDAK